MHRSRIQLPLTNPPIASYQADATILSVALQCDQSWNWFYNNFVQLCVFDQHGTQELKFRLLNRFPHEGSECPFVRVQYILRDYVAKAWSTISEFTKDAIKSLDHVFVCLDRYYLPYSPDYRSRHRPHQTLISAIDTDSKTAILSDFAGRRGYGRYSVRWSDLDQSFPRGSIDTSREADPWNILLVVLLRYQSVLYEFDFNRLMLLIDDYLGGRNYSDSLDKQSFLRARNAIYGVEIYRFLLDYATQVEFGMQGDRRIFQTLYDHKRAMSMRARFLYEKFGLELAVSNLFVRLAHHALVLRNTFLIGTMSRHRNRFDSIRDQIKNLRDNEIVAGEVGRSLVSIRGGVVAEWSFGLLSPSNQSCVRLPTRADGLS